MTSSAVTYKKELSSKEIRFYNLLQNNPDFDYVLFPEKIEENIGYFPFLVSGNLLGKAKSYWLLTMETIAKFHHFIKSQPISFVDTDQNRYTQSLKNTLNYASEQNMELLSRQIETLRQSLPIIESELQLIHEDFLPQNVMIDEGKIKIIDWEDAQFGFAEHDIGRFLGDLQAENPQWDKKYYPLEWRDSLENAYLQSRLNFDPTYDIDKGKQLIHIGEMWNYLGPIEMCLKRGETNSNWFLANLHALENC